MRNKSSTPAPTAVPKSGPAKNTKAARIPVQVATPVAAAGESAPATALSDSPKPRRVRRSDLLTPGTLPADGFISHRELLAIVPLSASSLRRAIVAGRFPKPVRLGRRSIAWPVAAVRDAIASLSAN